VTVAASNRIDRLRSSLEEPLLVTGGFNVLYLTGFHSTNAALIVEPERVRLFADFRYAEAAGAVEGVEFTEVPRNLFVGLAEQLSGRMGFEDLHVSYGEYSALAEAGLDLAPRRELVESLRAVKDEQELGEIRRAAEITSSAFDALADERFLGRTERELAWRMFDLLRANGADWVAFPPIVATGPSGARPHAEPGEREIEPGDTVVVDAGCRVGRYCSDCTRTFAAGPLDDDLKEAYRVCREAQEVGLGAVRAGASAREVDAAARRVVEAAGLADHFRHGLGHGVGLEVPEAPVLRPDSDDVLAAGNVVTVEPGIYISGRGGIRIEDLVVVTTGEPEILTTSSKELITVE
jgi:Xaa-Pro aminopeptidase